MDGIGLDQSQVADAINRKYQGMSQRERNQKMAQAQSGGGSQFQSQYSSELAQAQQPTEFWGAGRKLATNQNPDAEIQNLTGSFLSNLGGQKYYYGNNDVSTDDGIKGMFTDYGYKPTTKSVDTSILPLLSDIKTSKFRDQFYYNGANDPSLAQWGTNGYRTQDLGGGKYNIFGSDNSILGTGYKSVDQTIAELGGHGVGGGSLGQWEVLGQLLNGGQGGQTQWGGMPTNNRSDNISGLNSLFGSNPLLLGNKLYGYSSSLGPGSIENRSSSDGQDKWIGNPFGYQASHTGKSHSWSTGLGRNINDPSSWGSLTSKYGTDPYGFYVSADNASKLPGWTNTENYQHADHKQGFLQKIWEATSPTHIIAKQEFQDMQPIGAAVGNFFIPGLGSALNALNSYSVGDEKGGNKWLTGAATSYLGANYAPVDTGYGQLANSAVNGAITSGVSSLLSGQGAEKSLLSALFGGAGGAAGNFIGGATSGLGSGLSKFLGGAAQGAVSGLRDPEHMLESALTAGAAGGLGGIFNQGVSNPSTARQNNQFAKEAVNLAKLFAKGKK